MDSIEIIVRQAIKDGRITPAMRVELHRLCNSGTPFSIARAKALDMLLGALLTGEVVNVQPRQFINVMEELVLTQAVTCVSTMEASGVSDLDLGDIVAYALNRLPPLYATTEEGARFQREHADEQLCQQILLQVNEAIANSIVRPESFPERRTIEPRTTFMDSCVLEEISNLLETCAPEMALV